MRRFTALEVAFSLTRAISFERVTRNRIHRHSFFEPCIVTSGSGEFEHGGTVYPLRPGTLFTADPGVYHEIRSSATRDLRLYFLAFHANRASAGAPRHEAAVRQALLADFIRGHSVVAGDQTHLIPLFAHVAELSQPDAAGQVRPFHRQASLLLIAELTAALTASPAALESGESDLAFHDRLVLAIERRLHEPFALAALAADCRTSERTLRRRWRRCSRRSLSTEVNERRVERARHLLLLPDISVAEAGYQVGMSSAAQFSRLFRQLTGVTPTTYRERYLPNAPGLSSGGPPFRTEFLDGERREYAA